MALTNGSRYWPIRDSPYLFFLFNNSARNSPPPSWAHATGPSPNILRVQSFVLPDGCYYYTSSIHHAIIERVSIYTISSRSACASSSPNIFANEPMSVPISDVNELTKGGRLFLGEKTKIGQHVLLTGRLFSHCGEGEKPVGPVLIRRGGGGRVQRLWRLFPAEKFFLPFSSVAKTKDGESGPHVLPAALARVSTRTLLGPAPCYFYFRVSLLLWIPAGSIRTSLSRPNTGGFSYF